MARAPLSRLSGGDADAEGDLFYRNFQRLLAPLRENGANLWDLNLSDELTNLISDIQSWTEQETARLNTQQSQRRARKAGESDDDDADFTDDVEGSVAKDCAKLTRESEMTRIATTVHGRQVERFTEEFHDFYNYLCNDMGDEDDGKLGGKRRRAQRRRQKFDHCNVDDIDCNDFDAVFKKLDCGLFDFLDAPPPASEADDDEIELPDLNGEGNIVPKNKKGPMTILDVIRNESKTSANGPSKARRQEVFDPHRLIPEVMIASLPIKKQHKLEVYIPVRIEDDGIHCGDVNDYKINGDGLPLYGFFSSGGHQAEPQAIKSQPKSDTASIFPAHAGSGDPATQGVSGMGPFDDDIRYESMHVDEGPLPDAEILNVSATEPVGNNLPLRIPAAEVHHPAIIDIPDNESELVSASRAEMRNLSDNAPNASDNEQQQQVIPNGMQLRARNQQLHQSADPDQQQDNKKRSKKVKQVAAERINRLFDLASAGCWYTDNVTDDAEERFLRQHIRYSDTAAAERRQVVAPKNAKKVGGAFVKRVPPPPKPRRQHPLIGLERFMWESFDENGNENPPQQLVDTIYNGYNDSAFRNHMERASEAIEDTAVARRQEQQLQEREKIIIAPWLLEPLTEEQREDIMDDWRAAEMGNVASNARAAAAGGISDNFASQESHVERFLRDVELNQNEIDEEDGLPAVKFVPNDVEPVNDADLLHEPLPTFDDLEGQPARALAGAVDDPANTSQLTEGGEYDPLLDVGMDRLPQHNDLSPTKFEDMDPAERALNLQRQHIIDEEIQDENHSADYDEWLKLVKLFVEHDKKLSSFDVEKVGAQLIDAFFAHDADGRERIKQAVAAGRGGNGEQPARQQLAFADATANQPTPELAMNFVALMQQVFHGAATLDNVHESNEPQYAPLVVVKRGDAAAQNLKKNALRDLGESMLQADVDGEEDEFEDFSIDDA